MSYSHQKNIDLRKKKRQGILTTFMLESLLNIYSIGTWCIYGWYSRHYMSVLPIIYQATTWSKWTAFMLALLFQISVFDLLYNKKIILRMISFDGRLYEPFSKYTDLKYISSINNILKSIIVTHWFWQMRGFVLETLYTFISLMSIWKI